MSKLWKFFSIAAFHAFLFSGQVVFAQSAGDLDISFGNGGTVVTELGDGYDHCAGLVVQPDQKIVIAGSSKTAGAYQPTLIRFNPDGSYDQTFGSNGIVYSSGGFGNYSNQSNPLAMQPDGKLVHVCNNGSSPYDFLISRFNTDGTPDESFGEGGIKLQSALPSDDYPNAVAIQSDGKILVAGIGYSGIYQMAAMRFLSDGTLDNSFAVDGLFTLALGTHDSYIYHVLEQPDGKILMLCSAIFTDTKKDLVIIRLNNDGTYDLAFGDNGISHLPVTDGTDYPLSFYLQADGKIVVTGSSEDDGYKAFVLRTNSTGALDNSFGTGGVSFISVNGKDSWGESVTADAAGNIFIGGHYTTTSLTIAGMVAQFTPDGHPETSFGENGIGTIDAYSYYVENIALQADHKIVVCGWFYADTENGFEFAVSRLLSSGNVGISELVSSYNNTPFIFPVPGNGTFDLNAQGLKEGTTSFEITDLSGRILYQEDWYHHAGIFTEDINLQQLPPGYYMAVLENGSDRLQQKVIIQ